MIAILTILSFAVLLLRDSGVAGSHPPLLTWLRPGEIALLTILPLLAATVAVDLASRLLMIRLDRAGDLRAAAWIDRSVAAGRWFAILWHAVAVLGLGWLDVVRGIVPPWCLVLDELAAACPVLLVVAAGWWSSYPLERRIREALVMRALDEGRPLHPLPTRAGYVFMQVRHQMLLTLVPMLALSAWGHLTTWALQALASRAILPPRWLDPAQGTGQILRGAAQLLGLAAVFAVMPLVLKVVWRTTPLRAGPLRDALTDMCARHRVGVRDLLVWNTGGTMLNGAVIGLAPPLRFVLVTDALLESLPEHQVRAVLAHEVGHARHHHAPWLAAALLASLGSASVAADAAARALDPFLPGLWASALIQLALATLGLAVALAAFGWISRRFEWQADAFAAAHLTPPGSPITPDAVAAIAGALESVARFNGMPTDKFSWRHGSIRTRMRLLQGLTGMEQAGIPQNRVSSAVCWVITLAVLGLVLVAIVQ